MWSDLSDERLEELKEAFNLFDENGDGEISYKELENIMRSFGMKLSLEELKIMIAEIDADNSGTISLEEFLVMIRSNTGDSVPKEDIESAFLLFDKNKDGFITAEEFQKSMNLLGEDLSILEAEELIKLVTQGKESKISLKEFTWMIENEPN